MLVKDVLEVNLICYLRLSELAKAQAVGRAMRELLTQSSVWRTCISQEMPGLDITPELLATDLRPRLAQHFPALLDAHFACDVSVRISDIEEVERLSKLAMGAGRAAAAHMSGGGGAACTAVAKLRFPRDTLAKAMDGDGEEEPPTICCGAPIRFRISEELARALNCPSALLEVQFAWRQGKLLVRIQDVFLPKDVIFADDSPELSGDRAALTAMLRGGVTVGHLVDVSARHPAFTLHLRGGVAEVGGGWKPMGPGLTSANAGKAAAHEALVEGILCTVCVRDGQQKAVTAAVNPPKLLAHALHLDQVRLAR